MENIAVRWGNGVW